MSSIVLDINATRNHYARFQGFMNALAEERIPLFISKNSDTLGSIVMALMSGNSSVRNGQIYKFYKFEKEMDVDKLVEFESAVNLDLIDSQVKAIMSDNEQRKSWMPFLASLQLSVKSRDDIIYHRADVTRDLGVPSICEPFAVGSKIKDKLKKSRQMSIGPLVHLQQIKRLDTATGANRARLNPASRNAIRERLFSVLKRQSIGMVQRKMLDEYKNGTESVLSTLCLSYCCIKPHIEHNFVLTYPYIGVAKDFSGANFTDEWVWKMVKTYTPNIGWISHGVEWVEFLFQAELHCIFQTQGEDLGVLSQVFGRNMLQRKAVGKYNKTKPIVISAIKDFDYKIWSKPQKGAPRNLNGGVRGQICSRPSLRGQRTTFNNFESLEQLESSYMVDGAQNYVDAIHKEFMEYKKLASEGTGKFFVAGGEEEYNGTIGANNKYLFGN